MKVHLRNNGNESLCAYHYIWGIAWTDKPNEVTCKRCLAILAKREGKS